MSKQTQRNENLEKVLTVFISFFYGGIKEGLRKIKLKSKGCLLVTVFYFYTALNFSFWTTGRDISFFIHWTITYWVLLILTNLFIIGFKDSIILARNQNNLNFAGLTSTQGTKPQVLKVHNIDAFRTKVLVLAKGIGIDKFDTKKGDLESAFQEKVEKIQHTKDKKFVEIYLCKKELSAMIPYSEVVEKSQKEGSFILGESLASGFLTQKLTDLPHLLIGGTTGGGKSVYFKSTLLSLLKNTPHLQMYLIDLKKGLEVKEFSELPNVKIAKDEYEAVKMLQAIKNEMDRRYIQLEKSGKRKTLDPRKDKKDLIVLGIDEASVLYGKTSNKTKKEQVEKARDLTDELAKLARAAGIHLIIATQKPIKDSIDTKTLENLPGRMSFKMSTHAGSNSMLGNAKAYALADIKGRAIWKGGNKFIEVQTPFISDKELEEEISMIKGLHEREEYKNFEPLLSFDDEVAENQKGFDKNVKKAA